MNASSNNLEASHTLAAFKPIFWKLSHASSLQADQYLHRGTVELKHTCLMEERVFFQFKKKVKKTIKNQINAVEIRKTNVKKYLQCVKVENNIYSGLTSRLIEVSRNFGIQGDGDQEFGGVPGFLITERQCC